MHSFVSSLGSSSLTVAMIMMLPLSSLSLSAASTDPCLDPTVVNEAWRDATLDAGPTDHCDKDFFKPSEWYQFTINDQPATIPTDSIKNDRCGTEVPMRINLQGQALPENIGDNITAVLCGAYNVLDKYDTCVLTRLVSITRCEHKTLIYKFHSDLDRCPVAVCAQKSEDPLPVEVIAKMGEPHPDSSPFTEDDGSVGVAVERVTLKVRGMTTDEGFSVTTLAGQTTVTSVDSSTPSDDSSSTSDTPTSASPRSIVDTSMVSTDRSLSTLDDSASDSSQVTDSTFADQPVTTLSSTDLVAGPSTQSDTQITESSSSSLPDATGSQKVPSSSNVALPLSSASSSSTASSSPVFTTSAGRSTVTTLVDNEGSSEPTTSSSSRSETSPVIWTTAGPASTASPATTAVTDAAGDDGTTITPMDTVVTSEQSSTTTGSPTPEITTVKTLTDKIPVTTTATTLPSTSSSTASATSQPQPPSSSSMGTSTSSSSTTVTSTSSPQPTSDLSSLSSPSQLSTTSGIETTSSPAGPIVTQTTKASPGKGTLPPSHNETTASRAELIIEEKVRLVFEGVYEGDVFMKKVDSLLESFLRQARHVQKAKDGSDWWFRVTPKLETNVYMNRTTYMDFKITHTSQAEISFMFGKLNLRSFMLKHANLTLVAECRPSHDCEETELDQQTGPSTFERHAPVFITVMVLCGLCILIMVLGIVCVRCRRRGTYEASSRGNDVESKVLSDTTNHKLVATQSPFTDEQIMQDEGVDKASLTGSAKDADNDNTWVIPLDDATPTVTNGNQDSTRTANMTEDTKL